jgi:hypothetical protein
MRSNAPRVGSRVAGCRLDESDRQARGSRQGTDSLGRSTLSDSLLLDSEPGRISHNDLAPELVKIRIITDQTDISPGDIDAGIRVGVLWRTYRDPVGRAVELCSSSWPATSRLSSTADGKGNRC